MTRLQELRVEGFRGITNARLPFAGRSLLLGGGNGTGKTGFVDALEFLYTGNVGTLSRVQGLNLRQHAPHVRFAPSTTLVSGTLLDPDGTVVRRLAAPPTIPQALQPHMARGVEVTFLLRRWQLQEFIHARPADRYRRMADLVGADRLDRTEAALRRVRDTVAGECRALRGQIESMGERCAKLPPVEDMATILAVANTELEAAGYGRMRLTSAEDAGAVRADVLREVSAPDEGQMARDRAVVALRRGLPLSSLDSSLDRYLRLNNTDRGRSERQLLLDLLQILRRGRAYLQHSHADGRCPLCSQSVETESLQRNLARRIADLEEISLQQQQMDTAREDLEMTLRDLQSALPSVERTLQEAGIEGDPLQYVQAASDMLRESIRRGAPVETREMADRLRGTLDRWSRWSIETTENLEAQQDDTDGPEATQRAERILAVLDEVRTRATRAAELKGEQQRLEADMATLTSALARRERVLHLADSAFSTFNRNKTGALQRVYDNLRDDLVRFYDALHPGEGHGAVAIAMDPHKRGSSDLVMDFYTRTGEDPRAFASEGHLDSLGLCIFLAFVKRFNGDWPLLVLDDVVASVDTVHKRRIAALLFRDFGDRQLFITTHDSRWYADLVKAEEEMGHQATNMIIESWSLEKGPLLRAL